MSDTDTSQFAYLSFFDPARAFGLSKARIGAAVSRKAIDETTRNVIRLNLMWRTSVAFRHIDLFNNVSLMRVLKEGETECLFKSHLLRTVAPNEEPFIDLFREWALSTNGQHWHILSPIEQKEYNTQCQIGGLKTLKDVENILNLPYHGVHDLKNTLNGYDYCFGRNRIILRQAPEPHLYSLNVLERWSDYLERVISPGCQGTEIQLGHEILFLLELGAAEGWRRNRVYTELESLGADHHPDQTLNKLIIEAKDVAVNAAFYDELECMTHDGAGPSPIQTVRQYSQEVLTRLPDRPVAHDEFEECGDLVPFNDISFDVIAIWHTADDDESRAFQQSVRAIESIISGNATSLNKREIYRIARQHVIVVNECVRKHNTDGKSYRKPLIEQCLPTIHTPTKVVVAGLLGYVANGYECAPAIDAFIGKGVGSTFFTMIGSLATIFFAVPVRTSEYHNGQRRFKKHVEHMLGNPSKTCW